MNRMMHCDELIAFLTGHALAARDARPQTPASVLGIEALEAALSVQLRALRNLAATDPAAFVERASATLGIDTPSINVNAVLAYRARTEEAEAPVIEDS